MELGSPVAALPTDEWVNPACGTNGGPPSLRLETFEDFARCPVEAETGLREVWFIYDDEWEYIARAHRDPVEIGRFSANTFFQQPIITSLLIDEAGLVQGYRVVTNPRAETEVRKVAYQLFGIFKSEYSEAPWQCTTAPRDERELPFEGIFLKEDCVTVSDTQIVKLIGRHRLKPGQDIRDVQRPRAQAEADFESSVRLDVYNRIAVMDEPCCQAFARP